MDNKTNVKYLIFAFEPYAKHYDAPPPHLANDAENAFGYIMSLFNKRELIFIDVYRISDSLQVSKLDNKRPISVVKKIFKDFEGEEG